MTKLTVLLGFIAAFVVACNNDTELPSPPQYWGEIEIRVEISPSPPRPGIAEVLVIATEPHGEPVYDLIVSLRTADDDPWIQAIQDGHIGVYRRAAKIGAGERSVLQIQIRRGKEQQVLRFPLKLADQT